MDHARNKRPSGFASSPVSHYSLRFFSHVMFAKIVLRTRGFPISFVATRDFHTSLLTCFISRYSYSFGSIPYQTLCRTGRIVRSLSCVVTTQGGAQGDTKILWKDVYNLIDLPQNRKLPLLKRVSSIKDQVMKLGGKRVIIFFFSTCYPL